MIEPTQHHGKQEPETVEDLAPREDQSEGLKGGVSQENAHGSGGGAGRKASGFGGGGGGAGRS
jgi:hypothetical protein